MIHEYTEFGVTTKILKHNQAGEELKGMRAGKPHIIPEDPDDYTTILEWLKLEDAKNIENIFPRSVINLIG